MLLNLKVVYAPSAQQACGPQRGAHWQVASAPGRGVAMGRRYRTVRDNGVAVDPATGISGRPSLRWSHERTRSGSTRTTTRLFIICSTNGRISAVYGPWYRSNMLTAAAQYSSLD